MAKIRQEQKEPIRIGIFGASGSGKTYRARQLVANARRLIVFDPKNEWEREGKRWLPKFKLVSDVRSLERALRRNFSDFQIVYRPTMGNETVDLHAVATLIYAYQSGYKRQHMSKITFLIDEAQYGIASGVKQQMPHHGAILCARMGRDRGINLIVASQRIKTVEIEVRANLSSYMIFRLAELADINEAAQIVWDKNKLRAMPNRDFFHKDEAGKITYFTYKGG